MTDTITQEQIRAAGGIIHRDGNIFFTNIEQLRAALAQQAEQGWQPIATAPKDGKWALVYADEAVNCAFVKQGSLPKDWCGATMWNINPYQVTHWMSLPAAPKEAIK